MPPDQIFIKIICFSYLETFSSNRYFAKPQSLKIFLQVGSPESIVKHIGMFPIQWAGNRSIMHILIIVSYCLRP